jgi:hypothetical protein
VRSKLSVLEGYRLVEVRQVEDYVQLVFDERITLNIYSTYTASGDQIENITDLTGKTVQTITEMFVKPEYAVLIFNDRSRLRIDLTNPDPEAMDLHVPGEPIVVWN